MVLPQPEDPDPNPFQFCSKRLQCGHECKGVKGESECLPCLKPECLQTSIQLYEDFMAQPALIRQGSDPPRRSLSIKRGRNAKPPCVMANAAENELGGICFTSELGEEPCVRLTCGHVFHANCLYMMLSHRWTTLRITFSYLDCPSCKQEIMIDYRVPILTAKLIEQFKLKALVLELSLQMAKEEGLDKSGRVVTEGDIYFGKLAEFAMHNCTFFECYGCNEPYYGGMQDCMQAMQAENSLKKEQLLCRVCLVKELGLGKQMCDKHGNEFVDWKCMYCCSIALFICTGGTGNYCTPCHNDAMAGKLNPKTECTGGKDCPLGVPKHPKAGRDAKARFALGCSLCRSEKLELLAKNDKNQDNGGMNLERRNSMIQRFGGVKGHDINREMHVQRAPQPQGPN